MPSGYTSTAGGGALVPEDVQALLVEPLLAEAVVLQAGPRVFQAEGAPVQVPRITALELDDLWRAENTAIGEEDPTFGELTLLSSSLKSLKVIHRISNELARNAVNDVANVLSSALVTRVANAIDKAFLVGGGANNTVLGIANATGVQAVTSVGALTVDDLHDTVGLSLGANAKPSAWFLNTRDFITLRKAKDSGGSYLMQPDPQEANRFQLVGIPVYVTTQIPKNLGAGTNESRIVLADMSQVAVGRDQDVTVTILSERYGDYDQIGIRVTARFDIGLLNAEGVVVLNGVTA